MSSPIASYLPDSQLIKLGPDFAAFTDPDNLRGFVGAHEIAYIFHEWTHYLHNVSTIHGLSSFANLVHLWTVFRYSLDTDGLSNGSESLQEDLQLHVSQKLKFMAAARQPRRNALPVGIRPDQVRVYSVRHRDDELPGLTETTRTIVCDLKISNGSGDEFCCSVEIGAHEIIESVAYMLETRLTTKLGASPAETALAPYFLLEILAAHLAPTLPRDCVLICGLASLQDSDPATVLENILEFAHTKQLQGLEVMQQLVEHQTMKLVHQRDWIEERLCEIDLIFVMDEPMARAVRSTTKTIRANFAARRSSPFFELSLIDRIAANPSSLNEILREHGACAIMQQRLGGKDDIQRDLIYEFVLQPEHDEDLQNGRRVMHATFRFISLHSTEEGLMATTQLRPSDATKCPFYTVCDLELRRDSPKTCAETPWLAGLSEMPALCWYGQAIKKSAASRGALFRTD